MIGVIFQYVFEQLRSLFQVAVLVCFRSSLQLSVRLIARAGIAAAVPFGLLVRRNLEIAAPLGLGE